MRLLKELVVDLRDRRSAVQRRLEALRLEEQTLEAELVGLDRVLETYKDRDYDSITEERRVTESILSTRPKEEESHKGFQFLPKEKVRATIVAVVGAESQETGISPTVLSKAVSCAISEPISSSSVYSYAERMVKENILKKTAAKKYVLAKE